MIVPGTRIEVARIPLSSIVVTEHQARYPDRVMHYVALLNAPANRDAYAGLVSLKPRADSFFELLDGHHRYCASILCGRTDVLALLIFEPGGYGYDDASPIGEIPPMLARNKSDRERALEWLLDWRGLLYGIPLLLFPWRRHSTTR